MRRFEGMDFQVVQQLMVLLRYSLLNFEILQLAAWLDTSSAVESPLQQQVSISLSIPLQVLFFPSPPSLLVFAPQATTQADRHSSSSHNWNAASCRTHHHCWTARDFDHYTEKSWVRLMWVWSIRIEYCLFRLKKERPCWLPESCSWSGSETSPWGMAWLEVESATFHQVCSTASLVI